MSARTVLHVDMDAFYVSVELLRRPELRGRPVVVGGEGRRGVVAAASYEARRYGVHSAMPSAIAKRRCPHAVFLSGDRALYSSVSGQIREVFERFTALIEPLSLDEAFLDVSAIAPSFDVGERVANDVRAQVRDAVSLDCSVGVAPNKFIAKLASVEAKPIVEGRTVRPGAGVVVVAPDAIEDFLAPLPVERMWGVGPVTLAQLRGIGVHTVADLAAAADRRSLATLLGARQAAHLSALAHGDDDRPVEPDRAMKSVSSEETFADDLYDEDEIRTQVVRQADSVASRLRSSGVAARTMTLKVRYGDFQTITRSATVADACDTTDEILAVVLPLLTHIQAHRGVRLLGVGAAKLDVPHRQLHFDDVRVAQEVRERSTAAVDAVRDRFGASAIGPASVLDAGRRRRVEEPRQTCETEQRAEE